MRESLNEPVSVIASYNARSRHFQPHRLSWNNRDYILGKIDFYHSTRRGDKIIHHFYLSDNLGQVYFKLAFDASNLHWSIEEYMTAGEMVAQYRRPERKLTKHGQT